MFLEGKDYLSIWEVAHRWAGVDPDSTDQNNLPEDVRYYIHKMIEGYLGDELKLRRQSGYRAHREPTYVFIFDVNIFLRYLWSCLTKDNFNKKKLSNFYVRRRELINFCNLEEIEPPSFWTKQRSPEVTTRATVTNRPKDEEVDRLLCQAVALSMWELDQDIHPAHMAKSKAVQRFGHGRLYTEDTIKKWIAEVDPLKDQRKTGRPPEINYKIHLEMSSQTKD